MATPFRAKVEERANLVKAKQEAEPPTKRQCSAIEKNIKAMGEGDMSFVKDRVGVYQNSSHPEATGCLPYVLLN